MELKDLKGKDFKAMIASASSRLEENAEYVNSLNVFPVPDGDTGTNMNLTLNSGAKAVREADTDHTGEISKSLSKGLLMGARGNSGVILSQLFRGFSKAIENQESLDSKAFAAAFQGGVKSAYNAVMKPVEGTVLTVARESAKAGENKAKETDDIIEIMQVVLDSAKTALENTPEQLEVLKEVGVVDSGGQGLVYIYEGFLSSLTGEAPIEEEPKADLEELVRVEHQQSGVHNAVNTEDIEFGYCTEIMVRIGEGETVESDFDYEEFRNHLNGLGDSLLVVADDEIIKVHVHTERPGEVMNYGQKFGSLMKIKVDNMREQHSSLVNEETAPPAKNKKVKESAIISVSSGDGIEKMFESLGVDYVIGGGQTMNPSTEDIVNAMKEVPAKNYIILPNNKNIFLSAKQAIEVVDEEGIVIETRSIQQGLAAMLGYDETASLEENKEAMSEELEFVSSGEITNAIRDTEIDGLKIKKNDYMGIIDGDIKVTSEKMSETLLDTVDAMFDEDTEIITLFYGENVSETENEQIVQQLEEKFDDIEIEVHSGGQPVYPYLISVE